nr:MAG TPA: hypothetical protein [Caudoviricetes sp.]DAK77770.1 MAG TPA: hypothetical protein [Caudoviricetes sp.]DAX52903.1 MAG TPA: hypothetical protein [Caudoviricetes sp.]
MLFANFFQPFAQGFGTQVKIIIHKIPKTIDNLFSGY